MCFEEMAPGFRGVLAHFWITAECLRASQHSASHLRDVTWRAILKLPEDHRLVFMGSLASDGRDPEEAAYDRELRDVLILATSSVRVRQHRFHRFCRGPLTFFGGLNPR